VAPETGAARADSTRTCEVREGFAFVLETLNRMRAENERAAK
jgi:hypothetical protein